MDNQFDKRAPISLPDEQLTIDGITVRVYFSKEQAPDIMEKIETILFENLCAR